MNTSPLASPPLPSSVADLQKLGTALNGERRYAEAIAVYRKLLALQPDHGQALAMLGHLLFQLDQFAEAGDVLERSLNSNPHHINQLGLTALSKKFVGLPYQHFLTHILEVPARKPPRDILTQMWAALLLDQPELAFSFRIEGLNIMDWADMAALYRASDLQAKIQTHFSAAVGGFPAGTRPLIFAGGDGIYAARFAHDLISSALANSPGCDFHLHVMNPGAYNPAEALAAFPKDRLSWSTEEMGPVNKILYSPRRFIRMSQFVARTPRTLILVDTDSVINGDIVGALPAKFDVVVCDRPDQVWAHQMVNGGFLAVAPSGKDFLDFLAAYILHFESRGEAKWFDDQFGIVTTREWFRRNVPGMSIINAPRNMMDLKAERDPNSLIWHFKGPK